MLICFSLNLIPWDGMMTYDVDSYFYFIENNLAIYIIKINNTRLLKFWSLYFIRNIIDFFLFE